MSDVSVCSKCKVLKPKLKHKLKPAGNGYYYVDERSKKWNSNICPDCQAFDMLRRNKRNKLSRRLAKSKVEA